MISPSVPAEGAGHFDGDLVGLEFDQGFVDRDGIAGLLEPAADGGLGHGFAECRNANFSHCFVSSMPVLVIVRDARTIQQSVTILIGTHGADYWMPRFRGA